MMLERRGQKVGSGKDADTIGIETLAFLASSPEVLQRFLDVTGMEADDLRSAASHRQFFVGLLDFVLAHEPTVLDFASAAGLDPAEIGAARNALAGLCAIRTVNGLWPNDRSNLLAEQRAIFRV